MEWIAEEFHALTLDGNVCSTMLRKEQELVRCKDCAHGSLWCGNIKCVKPGMKKYEMDLHPVNWFCADGEHKEGR
jgi:hypothetical protein